MAEIPRNERLPSENYRIAAKEWVAADAAARLLEENRKIVFSQMMLDIIASHDKIPVSRAEMEVYASAQWKEYVKNMVEARTNSNFLRAKMKYVEMQSSERNSAEAAARLERKLSNG
jgi:ABC-type uncharacterized transport system auxiliary subunit